MSDGYNVLGYDVFLCHGGANDGVKQMLDDVKGRLQGLPTRGGGASIRAFLDERDLMWDGQPHSQIEEAPQKAPIGRNHTLLALSFALPPTCAGQPVLPHDNSIEHAFAVAKRIWLTAAARL